MNNKLWEKAADWFEEWRKSSEEDKDGMITGCIAVVILGAVGTAIIFHWLFW